jgi:hypothetical protein
MNNHQSSKRSKVGAVSGMCVMLLLATLQPERADSFEMTLPIDCEVGLTCFIQNYADHDPSPNARDYQCGTLTYDGHNGTDFRLPNLAAQRAGVNVLAAADGQVLRERDGMPNVSIRDANAPSVDGRECGNGMVIAHGEGWETQYCHLDQGSVRMKGGERVVAGQPIGRVGLSGRTEFPHLHFTVRQAGKVIDPFAYGAPEGTCNGGRSLWKAANQESLTYRPRAILNAGFASSPVTMEQIESGETGSISIEAQAIVTFVRAIGLKFGDTQRLSIKGPNGQALAERTEKPLDRDKAQVMLFVGKSRPPGGWTPGIYQASYSVIEKGIVVLERSIALSL